MCLLSLQYPVIGPTIKFGHIFFNKHLRHEELFRRYEALPADHFAIVSVTFLFIVPYDGICSINSLDASSLARVSVS